MYGRYLDPTPTADCTAAADLLLILPRVADLLLILPLLRILLLLLIPTPATVLIVPLLLVLRLPRVVPLLCTDFFG